jgi:hypothetical protein
MQWEGHMMALSPSRWWILLAAYLACGVALGLADPLLGRLALALCLRAGMATAATVNVLLPLAAAALAVTHRRLPAAWAGAVLMTLGLIAGLAVQYSKAAQDWSALGVLASIPPVLVLAGLGYAAVGTAAVLAARFVRKQEPQSETPPDPH